MPQFEKLFDPEILIPSDDVEVWPEFQSRLLAWYNKKDFTAGAISYEQLFSVGERLRISGLMPRADFYRIYGGIISRPPAHSSMSAVRSDNLESYYSPFAGHSDNADILKSDISRVDNERAIILASDERCWSEESHSTLTFSEAESIYLLTTLEQTSSSIDRQEFIRHGDLSPKGVQHAAAVLFPKLHFAAEAWTSIGSLSRTPRTIALDLIKHLGVLNDLGEIIWSNEDTPQARQIAFKAAGIEVSPENGATHRDKEAMRARTFSFSGKEHLCEWHAKLLPHRDRIYFAIVGDKVMVGKVIRHLK